MKHAGRWDRQGALVIAAILCTGCGRSTAPSESTPSAPAAAAPAPSVAAPAALNADQVCKLLVPEEVQSILDANPNPTPQPQPSAEGVSENRCVWDAGGMKGDLTLSVLHATGSGANAMIVNAMPMEGDAVSGIGDQAGVTVQGNYDVEVMARLGPRVLTVHASAVGVAARKDAVIAAARSAAARLR